MMSRRPNTPPKRRLSLSETDHQEKRPRSTESREASSASNRQRGSTTPPARDSRQQTEPTKDETSHERASHHGSERSSASPASSAAEESSTRRAPSPSTAPPSDARPRWRTDPVATSSTAPSTSERNPERQGFANRRDQRESREPGSSVHPMRSSSQPQLGASSRNYLSSAGAVTLGPNKQAAFVNKLYQMLEDPVIARSGLLEWASDGKSFFCNNIADFAREVLPNFFKHNNWQSFVRQLNMYSFNKVSDLYSTANVDPTAWEFRHPLFQRGEPGLLSKIKRKSNRHTQQESATPSPGEDELEPKGWTAARPHLHASHSGGPNGYYPSTSLPEAMHQHYYARGPSRAPSSGYGSVRSPSESPMSHPVLLAGAQSHSDTQVPQVISARSGLAPSPSRSDPAYYSATRSPTLDSLNNRVNNLQDTVHRLWSTLSHERQANARTNLEMSAYLIRMTDWLRDTDGLRVPREVLEEQRAELVHRYESLRDSELTTTDDRAHHFRSQQPTYYQTAPELPRPLTAGSYYQQRQSHTEFRYRAPESVREVRDRETPRAFLDTYYEYQHLSRPSPPRRHEPGERERRRSPDEPPKASLRNLLH